MSNRNLQPDIHYLPNIIPANASGGNPIIATGGGPGVVIGESVNPGSSAVDPITLAHMMRLTAVKLGPGTSQPVHFTIGGLESGPGDSSLLALAVGPSDEGDRIDWDFPVPLRGSSIFVEIPANGGNWSFVAIGFVA